MYTCTLMKFIFSAKAQHDAIQQFKHGIPVEIANRAVRRGWASAFRRNNLSEMREILQRVGVIGVQ